MVMFQSPFDGKWFFLRQVDDLRSVPDDPWPRAAGSARLHTKYHVVSKMHFGCQAISSRSRDSGGNDHAALPVVSNILKLFS